MADRISRPVFDSIHRFIKEDPSISSAEIARRIGISKDAVSRWRLRNKYPENTAYLSIAIETPLSEKIHKWLRLHKREVNIDEISDHFDIAIGKVRTAIEQLKSEKKSIAVLGESRISADTMLPPAAPTRIDISKFKGKIIRFGLTADEHLCSKYHRDDVREALFDIWEEQGITDIYECGNMIDGEARFNKHDLLIHGMQNQVDYFVEHWPQRKGMTTRFVTGEDHEGWYIQREGINIGEYIQMCAEKFGRTDLKFLGHMEHDVIIKAKHGEATLRVMHAGGGSAYATSYSVQKIVESLTGGTKPSVMVVGHYHKAEYSYIRNVHVVQAGCFLPTTRIETDSGRKPIANIRIGDFVLTHKNRYRQVTDTMKREYSGDFYTIYTGKSATGPSRGQVTSTSEHPFLTDIGWKPASELRKGDWVAVASDTSSGGEIIPWFRSKSNSELFSSKPLKGKKYIDYAHNTELRRFLEKEYPGERVVILDAVIPDAIHINWDERKVIAIEMERNRSCPANPKKYDLVPDMYDSVRWVCTKKDETYRRRGYKVHDGNVFVQIKRITRQSYKTPMQVFNFSVEDDNSYVAGLHVVHNCQEDQTPFMRKLKLQAHLGGWTVSFVVDDCGSVHEFTPQFHPFYDREFYEKNWQYQWKPKKK